MFACYNLLTDITATPYRPKSANVHTWTTEMVTHKIAVEQRIMGNNGA